MYIKLPKMYNESLLKFYDVSVDLRVLAMIKLL